MVVVLLVTGVACTVDESEGERGDGDGARDRATSTTIDPRSTERAAVVDARAAAERAQWESVGKPPNPDLPALAETMTGVALERARSDATTEKRIGTYYRKGPESRLAVHSVAFAGDVAYIESCEVWEGYNISSNGGVRDLLSGTNTVRLSEEMHKVDGRWRLALTVVSEQAEGVGGCALDERQQEAGPSVADEDELQAVVEARQAAEQDWLAAIIDPATPAPTETYTGKLLEWFTGGPEHDVHFVAAGVTRAECVHIWNDQTNRGTPERSCVDRVWNGSTMWTLLLRSDGVAFAPTSRSTVTVESVTWPDVETPQVAYLRTCRTFDVARADDQPLGTLPPRATVRATETMRLVDGRWKLTARWGYDVDLAARPCG